MRHFCDFLNTAYIVVIMELLFLYLVAMGLKRFLPIHCLPTTQCPSEAFLSMVRLTLSLFPKWLLRATSVIKINSNIPAAAKLATTSLPTAILTFFHLLTSAWPPFLRERKRIRRSLWRPLRPRLTLHLVNHLSGLHSQKSWCTPLMESLLLTFRYLGGDLQL